MGDLQKLLGTVSSVSTKEYRRSVLYGTLQSEIFSPHLLDTSKILFIDTENVKYYPFLEELTVKDEVNFVYTCNSRGFKFDHMKCLMERGALCNYIKTTNGIPNALDFVLVSALTEFVVTNKEHLSELNIYLISNDKGFFSTVNYLTDRYDDLNLFIVNDDC